MNDPHLVSLLYRLASEERIEFSDDLPAIAADAGAFTARLESGQLLIEMRDHFASAFDAFEVVNPYLRAWEVRHSL